MAVELYLNGLSATPSSCPVGLNGALRKPLRSPLCVFLKACRIVSMFKSLGPRCGLASLAEILVGGEVPMAAEEAPGDRIGEGDLAACAFKFGNEASAAESRRVSCRSCSP